MGRAKRLRQAHSQRLALGSKGTLQQLTPATKEIYACAIPPSAYFTRDGKKYSREDYYANPSAYSSIFASEFAPYLTTLINGAGWRPGFPRIITSEGMDELVAASAGWPSLCAIQDVTCDLKGNLEFVDRHTTIDKPYFEGPGGMLISTVDILPTELGEFFRNVLNPSLMS